MASTSARYRADLLRALVRNGIPAEQAEDALRWIHAQEPQPACVLEARRFLDEKVTEWKALHAR